MKLTYPVDTVPISDIPELEPMLGLALGNEGACLYVAYRFDPKCDSVRKRLTVEEKDEMASKLADWVPKEADSSLVQLLTTFYLRTLNSMDFEGMSTLELVHDETMRALRQPIDLMADDDKVLRAHELKQKLISGLSKIEAEILTRRQRLADGDETALKVLLDTAPARKSRTNPLTGKLEVIEE